MPYIKGDHKVCCDRCGFTRLRSQCKKTWDGLIVCYHGCWEPRNPQDYKVRGLRDNQSVKDPRPEPDPTYVTFEQIDPDSL